MNNDIRDAALVKSLVDGTRDYRSSEGRVKSLKALRELVWFYWENPRLPSARVKNKYPKTYPWSAAARAAFEEDPTGCKLVIEHAIPVSLVLKDLVNGPARTAEEILGLLNNDSDRLVIVTKEEDRAINAAGLRQKMPNGWQPGDDPYARHRAAGLNVDKFRPLEE